MAVGGDLHTHGPQRDAELCVRAALAMQQSLMQLNEQWSARDIPQLIMGIGLNFGEVIAGDIGSEEKMELTVIGDPINLASRLEALTKQYNVGMLLGESI